MEFVVNNGAGAYPGNPEAVGETVARWIREGKAGLEKRAANARKVARPQAAFDVADEVWEWAQKGRIPIYRRGLRERIAEIRANLMP